MRVCRPAPLVVLATCLFLAPPADGGQQPESQRDGHQHHHAAARGSLFPSRDGSGTAWQPDETPMEGLHASWRGWELMLHANAFAQVLYEPGDRHRTGGFATTQASSVNWGMAMARRRAGAGRLGLRTMISVEPWSVSDCGFLNLLATGERCEGDTIHDRQHPHDLVMELAAEYDRPLRGSLRLQVYGGLAGEPALGPVGFPHRRSALPNPVAPIAHHWQDASHVTFGVLTAAIYQPRWKAEASVFNGREPDEQRADLDLAALDSFSARVTVLPSPRLAVQVSAGHLDEAEAEFGAEPRTDVNRVTASAAWHRAFDGGRSLAATVVYGLNAGREVIPGDAFDATTHSGLIEGSLFDGGHTWFGRAEVVGKPAHDLHAHEYADRIFTVAKLQAGYSRTLAAWNHLTVSVGGTVSASLVPPELRLHYSGRVAPGFGVFLGIRPRSATSAGAALLQSRPPCAPGASSAS
jgi:hypothetical protein